MCACERARACVSTRERWKSGTEAERCTERAGISFSFGLKQSNARLSKIRRVSRIFLPSGPLTFSDSGSLGVMNGVWEAQLSPLQVLCHLGNGRKLSRSLRCPKSQRECYANSRIRKYKIIYESIRKMIKRIMTQ